MPIRAFAPATARAALMVRAVTFAVFSPTATFCSAAGAEVAPALAVDGLAIGAVWAVRPSGAGTAGAGAVAPAAPAPALLRGAGGAGRRRGRQPLLQAVAQRQDPLHLLLDRRADAVGRGRCRGPGGTPPGPSAPRRPTSASRRRRRCRPRGCRSGSARSSVRFTSDCWMYSNVLSVTVRCPTPAARLEPVRLAVRLDPGQRPHQRRIDVVLLRQLVQGGAQLIVAGFGAGAAAPAAGRRARAAGLVRGRGAGLARGR